jgi:SAM-dependent methyltransferase
MMKKENVRHNALRKDSFDNVPQQEEASSRNNISDWNRVYTDMDVELMPWYLPDLDTDLNEALAEYHLVSGSFLDVGTGPGTQAIALSKMGFEVTGVDISEKAIEKARNLNEKVHFIHDDILNTRINQKFNSIFDRGCFHVIDQDKRMLYILEISKLLVPSGYLFLKCFSDKNPDTGFGPYRFSRSMIASLFQDGFIILSIKDSLYQSLSNQPHQTLFSVLKKKE